MRSNISCGSSVESPERPTCSTCSARSAPAAMRPLAAATTTFPSPCTDLYSLRQDATTCTGRSSAKQSHYVETSLPRGPGDGCVGEIAEQRSLHDGERAATNDQAPDAET